MILNGQQRGKAHGENLRIVKNGKRNILLFLTACIPVSRKKKVAAVIYVQCKGEQGKGAKSGQPS